MTADPADGLTADGFRAVVATALGAEGACALPFALAVARQLAHGPTLGERVVLLLEAARQGGTAIEAGAATLALDHALLAAAYSNLDLLPAGCAAGDHVAAAVARALELLEPIGATRPR